MPPCTNIYFKRNAANVITCETRFRYRGDRSLQKSILAYKCLLIHRSLNHRSESLLTGQVDVRKMNVGPLQENILRVSARTYFARSSILLSHWKYQELSGKSAEKKVAAILSLSLWGTFPDCTKTKKIETKSNVRPLQSVSIQIDELRPGIKMTGGPCRHVVGYEKRKKKTTRTTGYNKVLCIDMKQRSKHAKTEARSWWQGHPDEAQKHTKKRYDSNWPGKSLKQARNRARISAAFQEEIESQAQIPALVLIGTGWNRHIHASCQISEDD